MNEKLDIGRVLERVFGVYRSQATLLIPAALAVFIPVAIINGLLLKHGGIGLALVSALVGLVATFWFQGMVVEAASDIMDGRRDHTIGSLFTSVAPVVGPLILAGFLYGLGVAIGLILIIVPGLILATIWAVIAPAIVIERKGVIAAFGRSRELVKGNAWQVFGVIVIIFLLRFVLDRIVQAIFSGSGSIATYAIGDLIVSVLVAPLSALAAAVMFFELRRIHGQPAQGAVAPAPAAAGGPAPPVAGTPGAPPPPAPGGQEQPPPPPPAAGT